MSGGIAPYSYLWSTGETSADIQVNAFGLYTLTVMDSDSCMIVDSIQTVRLDYYIGFYRSFNLWIEIH